ncbi:MAG: hypothetical protein IJG86_06045 [Clostridia bacterium]|nr:hypothetical protein [Clostridia bacterium]
MPVAAEIRQKKKKIKGQIPGTLYSWLVGLSVKRKCRVSKVLEEIALWACEDPDRVFPPPLVSESRSATGSHTYLNFNADERLLEKWESLKERHGLTNDSQTIRMIVRYRHSLSLGAVPKPETINGKPTFQQRFF